MHTYRIFIIGTDGLRICRLGMYSNDWAAIDSTLSDFGNARRILVRRMK
jgi:hypothetical protein